jgi:formylglycine-generating enzyme required for sulfatase activity
VTVGAVSAEAASTAAPAPAPAPDRVLIEGGLYRPLYRQPVKGANRDTVLRRTVSVPVAPFELDRWPVTNAQYLEFVRAHPEWRRSRVSRLYADASYLGHWRGDLELGELAPPQSPVVHVSWFAARAYAAAHGGRLPTVAEWELVAAADETRMDATRDPAYLARLREWYSRPAARVLPSVGTGPPNAWGVQDLHALVWEWTLDFSCTGLEAGPRGASLDRSLYCGAGRPRPTSPTRCVLRFAFWASLEADHDRPARLHRPLAAGGGGNHESPGPLSGLTVLLLVLAFSGARALTSKRL